MKYKYASYKEEIEAVDKMTKDEYDDYVRTKVQEALDDPRPLLTSEQVWERIQKRMKERLDKQNSCDKVRNSVTTDESSPKEGRNDKE